MYIYIYIYIYIYEYITHCNTLQRDSLQHDTALMNAEHKGTVYRNCTRCNTLQHTATHCNTLQHTATHCNTLQHTSTYRHCTLYGTLASLMLQCVAVCCRFCNVTEHSSMQRRRVPYAGNTLQHTATHCNTLQHTATRCIVTNHSEENQGNTLQHTATHCNIPHISWGHSRTSSPTETSNISSIYMQHNQPVLKSFHDFYATQPTCWSLPYREVYSPCNTLQHTATHCNTLQHTATHCNTLQHTTTHSPRDTRHWPQKKNAHKNFRHTKSLSDRPKRRPWEEATHTPGDHPSRYCPQWVCTESPRLPVEHIWSGYD